MVYPVCEYKLKDVNWTLRRENRQNFLDSEKSILNERNSNMAILFVVCNSYNVLKKCLKYLEQESNQNFDIIIVDNSTKNEEIKLIHDLWTNKKISIIKPTDNIGWSGWYSIWMEYIISKWYESLICFEDDVIPIDKNIISKTIELLWTYNIVGSFVNWEDVFWMFHIRWYSVKYLSDKLWVVDPRFFLWWDDADFQDRCIKLWIWDLRKNTGKNVYHPQIKKNKAWSMCFNVRNHLFYTQKYPSTIRRLFRDLCIYIIFWLSYYFITNQSEFLHAVFYWIYSFLFQKVWINSNRKILQKFNKPSKQSENMAQFMWDLEETNELLKNKYNLYKKLTWNTKFYSELTISDKPADWKNNGVVIAYHLSWRFAMLYKNIYCIDEYNYEEKKYYISIIYNRSKYKYLKMLLSLIITIILVIPIIIVVLFKILIENIQNKKVL